MSLPLALPLGLALSLPLPGGGARTGRGSQAGGRGRHRCGGGGRRLLAGHRVGGRCLQTGRLGQGGAGRGPVSGLQPSGGLAQRHRQLGIAHGLGGGQGLEALGQVGLFGRVEAGQALPRLGQLGRRTSRPGAGQGCRLHAGVQAPGRRLPGQKPGANGRRELSRRPLQGGLGQGQVGRALQLARQGVESLGRRRRREPHLVGQPVGRLPQRLGLGCEQGLNTSPVTADTVLGVGGQRETHGEGEQAGPHHQAPAVEGEGHDVGRPTAGRKASGPVLHPSGEGQVAGTELQGGGEGVAGGQAPVGGPSSDGERDPQEQRGARHHDDHPTDDGGGHRLGPGPWRHPPQDDDDHGQAQGGGQHHPGGGQPPGQAQAPGHALQQLGHIDQGVATYRWHAQAIRGDGVRSRRAARRKAAAATAPSTRADHSQKATPSSA